MARKSRIHFPGAFYHVMLRGNNKNQIFFSNDDKEFFYYLINDGIKRYGFRVHAFCLMSNHVHLAIEVGDVSLSKIIHNLSFRYTQHINLLQKKVGHLFQGRFKAILIEVDNYLLELVRYIHLNPVRAKIVNLAEEYFWSSHRTYLGLENISWVTCEYVLGYFENKDNSSLPNYARFINKNPNKLLHNHFLIGNQPKHAVLGSDEFLNKLKNIPACSKPMVSLAQIIKVICLHYSVDEYQLKIASRERVGVKLRGLITWLAKEFNICTVNDMAKYYNRDATGLARVIRRMESSVAGRNELISCKHLIEKSVCQA